MATVEGDPGSLDQLAESAADRLRTVHTRRGGGYLPQISYGIDGGTVVLGVVREARPSVEVAFEGLMVHVAPFGEIGLPAA